MFDWIKKAVLDTPVERLARRLYIRLDPSLAGKYDRETLAIMRRHITPSSNCIDIGAHRGSILAEILALAPAGTHHAFEPVPQQVNYLVKSFPTVKIYPLALSDERVETTFIHNLAHPTRSSFKQMPGMKELTESITVSTDLLDNVIPRDLAIHFIKLDVEGAELKVLRGAIQTIKRNKPLIIFEHSLAAKECYNDAPEDLHDFLTKECGFRIWPSRHWLTGQPSLVRDEFVQYVEQGYAYFVAAV